jgi:4-hydroxy-tetrahydrodipicolinate synthase
VTRQLTLQGTIPACILPFDEDYVIDVPEYRRHLRDLASTWGVTGIVCNGHAGEVAALSREEWRLSVATAVAEAAGGVHVISGVYAETHRDAADLARTAVSEGADAVLVFPPNLLMFDGSREAGFRRFAEIAAATDVPLVVFAYPAWTGMNYDEETLTRICAIPSVVAIKDWTLDIAVYERNLRVARAQAHHVAMLTSFSTHLLPTLALGADGILSGHGSVVAELQAQLFELCQRAELDAARAVYDRLRILADAVYCSPLADMYTRMKEQLVMLNRLRVPVVRPPLAPLGGAERAALRTALVAAGLLDVPAATTLDAATSRLRGILPPREDAQH